MSSAQRPQRHYFIDEAGDPILFARRGRVIIGQPGVSRFFMLGLLEVPAPRELEQALAILRHNILRHPYFQGVPSLQPEQRKTAMAFHAKDDLPEVRFLVFDLLRQWEGLRFFAIVADKCAILNEYVRQKNLRDPNYRYHPNELYDYLIRRLFRDRFTKEADYYLIFARRGSRDRTQALRTAIHQALRRYQERWHRDLPPMTVSIHTGTPAQYGGLQAVDYFLWGLQRLYERGEERFVRLLWPAYKAVFDIHDQAGAWGRIYSQRNPLTARALQGRHDHHRRNECP